MLTAHQVGARLGFGALPVDCTLMHDCEVRLCCSSAPGHVRIATQRENMRQAVARGRSRGPRPGLVDTRGGAARASNRSTGKSSGHDTGTGGGASNSGTRCRSGSPAATAAANTVANPALPIPGSASTAARIAAWIARDAPTTPAALSMIICSTSARA